MELLTFNNPYLSNYVNSYLLRDGDWDIFVDTGLYRQNKELYAPYLSDGKKKVVLSTHGHWDHIGMHAEIRSLGGQIYGNDGDRRLFQDHKWHWDLLFGQFKNDFDLPQARWDTFWNEIGGECDIDVHVRDGDILEFGNLSFKVIGLPGHTNGSVCYYEQKNGILFTGDGMMGDGFFKGIPQYCNYDAYRRSMQKLADMKVNVTYTCHTDPLQGEIALKEFAQRSIACADRIEKMIRDYVNSTDGPVSVGEAAAICCTSEGKTIGGGACVTALAHLWRLRDENPRAAACVAGYMCGC